MNLSWGNLSYGKSRKRLATVEARGCPSILSLNLGCHAPSTGVAIESELIVRVNFSIVAFVLNMHPSTCVLLLLTLVLASERIQIIGRQVDAADVINFFVQNSVRGVCISVSCDRP